MASIETGGEGRRSQWVVIKMNKKLIKAYLADAAESWKATHSDKSRLYIVYKQNDSCNFRIRAISSKKKRISITHMEPYTCGPATHYSDSNTTH
jgi:hypothetical protein